MAEPTNVRVLCRNQANDKGLAKMFHISVRVHYSRITQAKSTTILYEELV